MIQYFLLAGEPLPESVSLDLKTTYSYEKPLNYVRGMDSTLNLQSSLKHNLKIDVTGSGFYSSYFSHLRPGQLITIAPNESIRCRKGLDNPWKGSRMFNIYTGSATTSVIKAKVEVRNNTAMFEYEWAYYYPVNKPALQYSYYIFYPQLQCVVTDNGCSLDRSGNSFTISFMSADPTQLEYIGE